MIVGDRGDLGVTNDIFGVTNDIFGVTDDILGVILGVIRSHRSTIRVVRAVSSFVG